MLPHMPGQSVSQIRRLLAQHDLRPQHRFGQNFLVDRNYLEKLLTAADVQPGEVILEVGPGTGTLTELLLARGARVVAVEIDRGLTALLTEHFAGTPDLSLLCGDVLASKHALAPEVVAALAAAAGDGGTFKLVANLPYQVATPLLIELLHLDEPAPTRLAATIQREVADRLLADAGTPAYGPLSVIAQTLAAIKPIANLPAKVFWPAPKVTSTMVQLTPVPADQLPVADAPAFARFVQSVFSQRRKTLRRALTNRQPQALPALAALRIDGDVRPEQLTPAQWQALFSAGSPPSRA